LSLLKKWFGVKKKDEDLKLILDPPQEFKQLLKERDNALNEYDRAIGDQVVFATAKLTEAYRKIDEYTESTERNLRRKRDAERLHYIENRNIIRSAMESIKRDSDTGCEGK
jgi:hypothetical protein